MKCRARAMRWVEEVYTLAYEMMRVPAFCSYRSKWWQERASLKASDDEDDEGEGKAAHELSTSMSSVGDIFLYHLAFPRSITKVNSS